MFRDSSTPSQGRGAEASARSGGNPDGGTVPREHAFQELIENALRGHAIMRGRQCVYSNPAFARLLGFATPRDAMAVPDIFALVAPEDQERLLDDARKFARGDPSVRAFHQFRMVRQDGSRVWLEVDVRNITWEGGPALHVVGLDISQAKALEESRHLLASAFEQAQEGIYIADTQGTILYANPRLSALTGYSRAELEGANPRLFKSGKHGPEHYQAIWKDLLAGQTWAGRFTNRRKDGALIEMDTRISPVRDSSGQITHFIGVQYDVTQQVALEARLRQAEKMETLGQLAGGVAHDFNNLLQVISGWTHLLMDDCPQESPQHRNLQRIDEAVKRATGMTRQLLTMSRKSLPRPRPIDLNAVVEGQVKMLGRLLGEHVDLQRIPARFPANTVADPGMVEQVVMNLCINARDAMPEGGKLVVETTHCTLDEAFCQTHAWARPGTFVRLSVSDSGQGMPPEVQKRIFEPFFTTKEPGKGTGLGLATVMSIAEHHQALLHVYSEPGLGSTFHVYFPAIAGDAVSAEASPAERPRQGQGERILLVEDDLAVGEFMREALQRGGYAVQHAVDGQMAVDLFLSAKTPFDLVILDMVLPKLTGRQAFQLMRGLRPDTRFLFSSGYSPHLMDVEFITQADMPLIQKPYAPRTLLAAVGNTLAPPAVPPPEGQA